MAALTERIGCQGEAFIEEVIVRRGAHLHLKRESSKPKPSSDQLGTLSGTHLYLSSWMIMLREPKLSPFPSINNHGKSKTPVRQQSRKGQRESIRSISRWSGASVLQLVKPKTESTKQLCKEWMIKNSQLKWIQEPSSVVDVEVVQVLISDTWRVDLCYPLIGTCKKLSFFAFFFQHCLWESLALSNVLRPLSIKIQVFF